ncbi:hypothetical protein BDZ97DRAFT_1838166 [Flammula alnicola]|nr:hypothetical protein BDZ97DRAFT_1838166 [Flammula alnicola]
MSKLPLELFSAIFSIFQRETGAWSFERGSNLEWIKVTHICRKWREMAINSPNLWTRIPFDRPRWTTEMLTRSRTDTLIVNDHLDSLYSKNQASKFEALKAVFQCHLSRVGEITLRGASRAKQLQFLLQDVPPTSVPRLQSISISGRPSKTSDFVDTITLLENSMNNTDRLRKLEVLNTVRWDSRLLNNLTHLTISNDLQNVVKPSQAQFFNALRRMPSLQQLRHGLHGSTIPEYTGGSPPTPTNVVHLHDLESLYLSDTTAAILNVLDHIRFPPTAALDLSCTEKGSNPDFSSFVTKLQQFYPNSHAIPGEGAVIRSMCVIGDRTGTTGWSFELLAWSFVSTSPLLPKTPPLLRLVLSWDYPNNTILNKVMVDVCHALPCRDLAVLYFTTASYSETVFNSKAFVDAFGSFSNLHSVYLVGNELLKPFLRALIYQEPAECHFKAFPLKVLYKRLKQRSALGRRLEGLELRECRYLDRNGVALLKEHVVNVTWDGSDVVSSEEEEYQGYRNRSPY